jgi:5-methylcytosine-specific restriction endonuclease McrA
MRRHARKLAAAGAATLEQIAARVAYYGWRCWMCRGIWEEIDHVLPLARGGSNWPSNLRPACAKCNGRKWAHKPTIAKAAAA